jgi:putative addiction module component (TIGR02574 family)
MFETRIEVPPSFNDLSKADQVRYLQELWDQIADSPGDIPVPESHLELAEARLRRYRDDPSKKVVRRARLWTGRPVGLSKGSQQGQG